MQLTVQILAVLHALYLLYKVAIPWALHSAIDPLKPIKLRKIFIG